MKSTGIVRRVDRLGRVVIPIELRGKLDMSPCDTLRLYTEGDKIIIKKYHPACVFCGDARDIAAFKDKLICGRCLREIAGDNTDSKH